MLTTDHTGSVQTVSVNTSQPSISCAIRDEPSRKVKGLDRAFKRRAICRRDDDAFPQGNPTAEDPCPVALLAAARLPRGGVDAVEHIARRPDSAESGVHAHPPCFSTFQTIFHGNKASRGWFLPLNGPGQQLCDTKLRPVYSPAGRHCHIRKAILVGIVPQRLLFRRPCETRVLLVHSPARHLVRHSTQNQACIAQGCCHARLPCETRVLLVHSPARHLGHGGRENQHSLAPRRIPVRLLFETNLPPVHNRVRRLRHFDIEYQG